MHIHEHHSHARAGRAYAIATILGLTGFTLQMWGSNESHSAGLFADAFHLATDIIFNGLSWLALVAPAYTRRSGRIPGLLLCAAGLGSLYLAADRIYMGPHINEAWTLLLCSVAGFLINLLMLKVLKGVATAHTHAHGHSHHHANLTHVLGDAVTSVGVIITAALFILLPNVPMILYLDPLAASLIGLWLLKEGLSRMRLR